MNGSITESPVKNVSQSIELVSVQTLREEHSYSSRTHNRRTIVDTDNSLSV